jgi:hypothetical protein
MGQLLLKFHYAPPPTAAQPASMPVKLDQDRAKGGICGGTAVTLGAESAISCEDLT